MAFFDLRSTNSCNDRCGSLQIPARHVDRETVSRLHGSQFGQRALIFVAKR
jgi:hypothetical protein